MNNLSIQLLNVEESICGTYYNHNYEFQNDWNDKIEAIADKCDNLYSIILYDKSVGAQEEFDYYGGNVREFINTCIDKMGTAVVY